MTDPVQQARDLVLVRFPEARAAFLAGSSAAGRAAPTSDLDIVVVRPTGGDAFRETLRHDGRLTEWFVNTAGGYQSLREGGRGRAIMPFMCGHGISLLDRDGTGWLPGSMRRRGRCHRSTPPTWAGLYSCWSLIAPGPRECVGLIGWSRPMKAVTWPGEMANVIRSRVRVGPNRVRGPATSIAVSMAVVLRRGRSQHGARG
jgi:hypothetical protein